MSHHSAVAITEEKKKSEDSVALYHSRALNVHSSVTYTSSLVVNLRQLQTDIHTQYKHEKTALTELNERFRHFVERVHKLEAQNAKYLAHLGHFRQQSSEYGSIDAKWSEQYLHRQSDLTTANYAKAEFELEVEMYHLQAAVYQQMIEADLQWKDGRRLKLEQELTQSSTALNALRVSYAELGRNVESLSVARADSYQQYMKLTTEWCRTKKTAKQWQLSLQSLKNYISFYKNLRSYSVRGSETVFVGGTFDVKQFWALELEKSVKKIRADFALLYGSIEREMSAHYTARIEEAKVEIQEGLRYHKLEIEEMSMSQQTLQTVKVEYEKVQASYSHEEQIHVKLEASFSKIESDFQSIQFQNDERIELQTKDLLSLQENIMAMAYEIEDMRQRKISLEGELIVYRHLLGEEQKVVITTPGPVSNIMTRRLVTNSQKKGTIGISECSPDGAYIALVNNSTSEGVDMSKWVLKRLTNSKADVRYTFPDRTQLPPGGVLRIYAKLAGDALKSLAKRRAVSSSRQELVNSNAVSWGTGDKIETTLTNQKGEQKAIYSQSISLEEATI